MIDEEKHYFDSWDALNCMFAGNLRNNLREAEEKLSVKLVVRDSWMKIDSEDPADIRQTLKFLAELKRIFGLSSKKLEQHEFDHILSAFSEKRDDDLKIYFAERVKVSPRKKDIIPRNKAQLDYIRNIREKEIVFGIGPAGTGKTYLAMSMAIAELIKGNYSRIVLTRPAREAGENLGFLPGTLEEKVLPYLRPLYDALYDMMELEEAESLIQRSIIEIAPLAFMRGRTLNNAFIILDEAQNTSPEQMMMFLTRLGFNSRCVVTGDPSQTDLGPKQASGLLHSVKILRNIPEIAVSEFTPSDVVRNSLVEKIVKAYEDNSNNSRR